ncbi:MAG TPA: sigma-70 family RNA polymerase sigma factor [Gemmataceae bacterium]|nr:sigma-70 family RNA polymerase sigma factor [Gemmataceae bacterium]
MVGPSEIPSRLPLAPRLAAPDPPEPAAPEPLTPEVIFSRYAPRVYNLARRLLGNEADAEDVTQDVFVQLLRKLPTFRGEAAFPTWLYRVTVNAALAYRRKRALRKTEPLPPEPLEDFHHTGEHRHPVRRWATGPEQLALDHEARRLIEAAIAELPEAFRDVYVLADVEELPNAKIAEVLDLSVAAVKSRLHRARLLLRKRLAPHFEEEPA